ncbi:MAG: electron transport complex subunit RsxC [Planctomycetota bacterium]|nr:electron transport complex subunit RsxC [Planctomycetota bacterium]
MNIFRRHPKTFAHGIHPPEHKDQTNSLPIRQFPFAPALIVPLKQHIGNAAVPVVREGQEVTRGQLIAEPDGFVSVALHAPSSGIVRRIGLAPSITGEMRPAIFIEPFPASTQERLEGEPCDVETATPSEIIQAVQQAGIVGLGGAGFPSHAKMQVPEGKFIDTLIINGAECEPYLTADHRVMLEQPQDVILGVRYLLKATAASKAIIGIEANKQDAADSLRAAIPDGAPITVEVLPVKFPQGAAEMLIKVLLGREKPTGARAADIHTLVFNVTSTSEIGRLLPHGAGLQERVITISGSAVRDKGNYRIAVGTPIRFVLEQVGLADDVSCVFLGGPMMGQALSSLDIPVMKDTLGVVALTERETGPLATRKEYACIRCAACVDACPMFLNPSQLGLLAKHGQFERMQDELHLSQCFECGSCTFVCPSHIPLVHDFRIAKAALWKARASA